MNLFKITTFSALMCLANLAQAIELNVASGIEVVMANNEVVEDNQVSFVEGENQLVIEFSGRLKDGAKREYFSSKPFLVTIDLSDPDDLDISLISNKLSKVKNSQSSSQPIFMIEADGSALKHEQFILPPGRNAFPYTDIPGLVQSYNQEHGLVFDSGKIRSLKEELAAVQTGAVVGSTVTTDSTVQESENTLQLKLWYSRANEEERKAFQKWLVDQK